MADEQYNGRKPSYNFGRGGASVQGFRSRPGAPMHDPTSNIPMSRESMTPKSNWDWMFRNSLANGRNPISSEFRSSGDMVVDPELDQINQGLQQKFNPQSLEVMASGGMNHAQRWSQAPALKAPDRSWSADPFMPKGPKDKFYIDKQGGFFESPISKDGWKSTSGREVAAIGDKYKSKSPFGWGSAFKA